MTNGRATQLLHAVAGQTATFRDGQLELAAQRGSLDRESLHLHAADIPHPTERMAWLAAYLPRLPGCGIVYCLTVTDAQRVATWLREQGVDAEA